MMNKQTEAYLGHSTSAPNDESLPSKSILDRCHAALVVSDPNGKILFWNAAAENLFAAKRELAVGQPLLKYLRADLYNESFSFLEAVDRGNEVESQPLLGTRSDGEPIALIGSARPIQEKNGKLAQVLLTLMEAPRKGDPLPHELTARTSRNVGARRVISYLSHEVRIPLAAILGFAEMMYDARQTVTERMACISRIRNNVKHLTELMDDISDLSLIDSGDLRLNPVTFSLLPELGEIFSLLQAHAWKKRLELRVTFLSPVPEIVHLDASRLRQILINVVGELIEETSRGMVGIEIEAKQDDPAQQLNLVFHISGPIRSGTAEQTAERFEPFPRREDSSGFLFGGHRLGLALARRLARLLDGDVVAAPGEGFYRARVFTIFVRSGAPDGVHMISEVNEADLKVRDATLFTGASSPLDGMHILLVEDSPDIQILIRHFLKKFGATVELAENGEEGVVKAAKRAFDVILMDLQLPILNGFEATQQLRRQGYHSPIIALTAHALNDVRDKCLQAGFDEYMTKPIHASALIDALQRHYHTRNN